MTETPPTVEIQYGVEYLEPQPYAGLIVKFAMQDQAEQRAKSENSTEGYRCRIVVRKVTYEPWQPQELADDEELSGGLA